MGLSVSSFANQLPGITLPWGGELMLLSDWNLHSIILECFPQYLYFLQSWLNSFRHIITFIPILGKGQEASLESNLCHLTQAISVDRSNTLESSKNSDDISEMKSCECLAGAVSHTTAGKVQVSPRWAFNWCTNYSSVVWMGRCPHSQLLFFISAVKESHYQGQPW